MFAVGDKASVYTNLATEADIITKILIELDEIFDGKASQAYIKHIVQDWSNEPFIQGSYGIDFDEDESTIVSTLAQPIDNKVFFAGEVYSSDNGATVPGASETAYDAIEIILKD